MEKVKILSKSLSNEGVLVTVEGEVDAANGAQLRDELEKAAEGGARWLFVDLGSVTFIDSVGLGILVGAAKQAWEREGNIAVLGARPNVMRVFEVSGTRELLNVTGSLEEAQGKLGCVCEPGERGEKR